MARKFSDPLAGNRTAKAEEQDVRKKLLALKQMHRGLYIPTPWGIVDAGSTAALYGEGPNVVGFQFVGGSFAAEHCVSQKEIETADSPRPVDCQSLWEHAQDWAQEHGVAKPYC